MNSQICNFAFAALVAFAARVHAEPAWTLQTADFKNRQVELSTVDAAGAKVVDKPGESPKAIPWDSLLSLERSSAAKQPAAGKYMLVLSGGDQIVGEPVKLEGEVLRWSSSMLGEAAFPLRQVTAISRAGQPPPAATGAKRTEDIASLANGDAVRGIVSDVDAANITIQSGGNAVAVPLESVTSVQFASTDSAKTSPHGRVLKVSLADNSVVSASDLQITGDRAELTVVGGGRRTLPLSSVAAIEQVNGPVAWLSSRTPEESVHTPFLSTSRPARMDRAVTGEPIRFGQRTYTRGIGVQPYSRITWALDPAGGYKTFRTRYAIDGGGAYANVTVRILLDGKVAHERKDFTAGELSPVLQVPLANAKTLALEVDFGGNYGVQDRFNWIEPALVK